MDEYKKQFLESFDKIMESSEDIKLPDDVMKLCWRIWQASRAAIGIKAPRFISSREALAKGYTVDYSNGFGDGMDAYEENIRAAGIKVKE